MLLKRSLTYWTVGKTIKAIEAFVQIAIFDSFVAALAMVE